MTDAEELMTDIHNTLVQIRYPKITTTAAKNIQSTILKGENRLSLLSWLLCEISITDALKLPKLTGPSLEAELLKCYSDIGICTDKKLLLGDCPLEEQLPILRLLLDFIKCVFIESPDIEQNGKVSVDNILNVYINDDPNAATSNIQPKLTYSESIEYFNDLSKYMDEHRELLSKCESESVDHLEEIHSGDERKEDENEIDRNTLFNTEKKNFVEAFSTIGSWPMFNIKNVKNNLYSMDADMNDTYTNFTSLTQFLQAKEEILNANLPMEINKSNTRLSEIVEEAVMHTEQARSVCIDNY